MIARGAIIKPWIFEEIQQRQHIDKAATERLDMLKQFAYWGLEHWVSPCRIIFTLGIRCGRCVYNEKILLRVYEFLSSLCSFGNIGSSIHSTAFA